MLHTVGGDERNSNHLLGRGVGRLAPVTNRTLINVPSYANAQLNTSGSHTQISVNSFKQKNPLKKKLPFGFLVQQEKKDLIKMKTDSM